MMALGLCLAGISAAQSVTVQPRTGNKGYLLEELSWNEAEQLLKPDTVVVIPLGAESKEHGYHLKLGTDFIQAEYFKTEVLKKENVVVAPTVNYNYFPAFAEYPGTISLSLETSRDMIVEICRSLAQYGPHRFYVINMGVSTLAPLEQARNLLTPYGIILTYTGLGEHYVNTMPDKATAASTQTKDPDDNKIIGTHAHEWETSVLLAIAPETVDMSKAVRDYHPSNLSGLRKLTRNPLTPGTYSPSGVYGDATLATKAKGEDIVRAELKRILADIDELKTLGTHME